MSRSPKQHRRQQTVHVQQLSPTELCEATPILTRARSVSPSQTSGILQQLHVGNSEDAVGIGLPFFQAQPMPDVSPLATPHAFTHNSHYSRTASLASSTEDSVAAASACYLHNRGARPSVHCVPTNQRDFQLGMVPPPSASFPHVPLVGNESHASFLASIVTDPTSRRSSCSSSSSLASTFAERSASTSATNAATPTTESSNFTVDATEGSTLKQISSFGGLRCSCRRMTAITWPPRNVVTSPTPPHSMAHFYEKMLLTKLTSSAARQMSEASNREMAVRLADDFRPRSTKSQLIRRGGGRYNEPYAAIVERDDAVSVLCVQLTRQQVLVRHMPEEEWNRIVREGEKFILATLPAGAAEAADEPHSPEQQASPSTAAAEPPVFDYFMAPENRIEKLTSTSKASFFSQLRLRAHYSRKELERMAREDRRAMLSVERRNIFLRQYQRDMQHRMAGTPLYTVGRELPEEFIQLFFMSQDHHGTMTRRPERSDAVRTPQAQRSLQRSAGGRHLFTIDRSFTCFGERLPFAGQAPVDGFVVVTVAPTADAFTSAWGLWDEVHRLSSDTEEKPFVPCDYGSADYLPRAGPDDPRDPGECSEEGEAGTTASAA
ncbi:hypothetical protein CGC20_3095 [Leishmania donovani]|uniref:Uncharacterized protein n=1 Tax=Leishmania donovani TaxID=5661 RepID=A0A504X2Z0_LEIDO|nr:hypothetical protein CGC20_3095 [Leishmania donovani]